jgi:hypothetical protein
VKHRDTPPLERDLEAEADEFMARLHRLKVDRLAAVIFAGEAESSGEPLVSFLLSFNSNATARVQHQPVASGPSSPRSRS